MKLVTRETSLGRIHSGIISKSLTISRDTKHVAYAAGRGGGKMVVVVGGQEGKEYDGFLRGSKPVFDSAASLHSLGLRNNEIFLIEIEIVEK